MSRFALVELVMPMCSTYAVGRSAYSVKERLQEQLGRLVRRIRTRSSLLGLAAASQALLINIFTVAPLAAQLTPEESIPEEELQAFVDGAVSDLMRSQHVAGVSIAIVQNDAIAMLKGYGFARRGSGQAVDPSETLFRVGSLSKAVTWLLLMTEVERGNVARDEPVNTYLPAELQLREDKFSEPVRIIHLLGHSSGFEDTAFGHLFLTDCSQVRPLRSYLAAHQPQRVREPGVLSTYSNYATILAGYIVTRTSGMDFATLAEDRIFRPAGMTSSTFREPCQVQPDSPTPISPELESRLAVGLDWTPGGYVQPGFTFLTHIVPAGSLSTSASDIARYMLLQLNGGMLNDVQIYGPMVERAFQTPVMEHPAGGNGWAHGLMISDLPGGFAGYGHTGAAPSFFAAMTLVPELDLGVFIAANSSSARVLRQGLAEMIVKRFYVPSTPDYYRLGDPEFVAKADFYSGDYISTRRAYSGLEGFMGYVRSTGQVAVTPTGYLVTRAEGVTKTWVPADTSDAFRSTSDDTRLVFELDEAGRAIRFADPGGMFAMERLPSYLRPNALRLSSYLAIVVALGTIALVVVVSSGNRSPTWRTEIRLLSLVSAVSVLVAGIALINGLAGGFDPGRMLFDWPGPLLLTMSWAALATTVGAALLAILVPSTWRTPGLSPWVKAWHLVAVVGFLQFGVMLALRGGLIPWH